MLAAAAPLALAQQDDARGPLRIEVTGSNIPRTDVETALPLQTITRDEIERSGATTPADVLERVSANVLGFNDRLSIFDSLSAPGISSVNLRGIGDGSTLILVNGHRVANYAFDGGTVDVNSIPLVAIDRIEILKDGASSIYGTDAIAGVVNFILRKEYHGFAASAFDSWTQHGGGGRRQFSLSAGTGDLAHDRYNAFATLSYQKDDALRSTDRAFSRTGDIPGENVNVLQIPSFPANIRVGSGAEAANPELASGCAPPASLPAPNPFAPGNVCGFDVARFVDLVPTVERTSAFGRATFQATPDHRLFVEANWSNNRFLLRTEPTPASFAQSTERIPLLYPADGPYYPTAFAATHGISGDLNLSWRTLPLGQRIHSVDTTAWRTVLGIDGYAWGWDYSAGVTYSFTGEHEAFDSGDVSQSLLRAAMATGLINPFGPSGPEGQALLLSTQVSGDMHHAEGTTISADFKASRDLYRLPAGPLAIALGIDARRERLTNEFSPFVASGDFFLAPDLQSTAGKRSVQAFFAEANVPLFADVEAQVAARYDHYSDFGGTVNPKIALRWRAAKSLLLRTSWGAGYRAPTLYDLNTPAIHARTGFGFSDPLRCPVTQSPADCDADFALVGGGNPNLEPETSRQFNAGIVWQPVPPLSITTDYWHIAKDDAFGTLPVDAIFADFQRFASTNVVRGPVDPAFPNLPGAIELVDSRTQNIGRLRTSGIDLDVAWRGIATRAGRVSLHLSATYYIQWKMQADGQSYESALGNATSVAGGPFPHWKHQASLEWTRGPWAATLAQTYQGGYEDWNVDRAGNPLPRARRVSPYDVWDLDVRYVRANTTYSVGVQNLLDRAPPFTNAPFVPVGFDPTYADPRGRTFYAKIGLALR